MNGRLLLIDIDGVRGSLNAKIRLHSEHVLDGKCADYAEYKEKCARIRGLRDAHEIINEQLKKQSEDDT